MRVYALQALFTIVGAFCCASAWALTIEVLLSDDSPPYYEVANSFRSRLQQSVPHADFVVKDSSQYAAWIRNPDTRLLLCIGVKATQDALESRTNLPILSVLVPKDSFDLLAQNYPLRRSVTAIYLDQPYARQLAMVRFALPDHTRVGVLLRTEDQQKLEAIEVAAKQQKMQVISQLLDPQTSILPALQQVLAASDVLLVLPDTLLYNKNNIQSILLTSYRYRDPVMSYSQALVRAGAMLGLYSRPSQIGFQAAEVALHSLQTGTLPMPLYPKYFTVGVNRRVAHSLRLPAQGGIELQEKLQQWERAQK